MVKTHRKQQETIKKSCEHTFPRRGSGQQIIPMNDGGIGPDTVCFKEENPVTKVKTQKTVRNQQETMITHLFWCEQSALTLHRVLQRQGLKISIST
jgi:hypothetical protein